MKDKDEETWHEKMKAAGWKEERDMYGVIVAYRHCDGAIIEARDFDEWRRINETPPPF